MDYFKYVSTVLLLVLPICYCLSDELATEKRSEFMDYEFNSVDYNRPPTHYECTTENRQQTRVPTLGYRSSIAFPPSGSAPLGQMRIQHSTIHHTPALMRFIINGQQSPERKFFVKLQFLKHFCGGTFVHPRVVLTAAHCVVNIKNPAHVSVQYGNWDVKAETRMVGSIKNASVEAVFPHPNYVAEEYKNDIAILILKEAVSENDVLRRCDADDTAAIETSENLEIAVSGLGMTELGAPSDYLLETYIQDVTRENPEFCTYGDMLYHPETEICAGLEDTDSCQGDSGGPLFAVEPDTKQAVCLYGIVSYGSRDCDIGPAVYTRVSSYKEWIDEIMASMGVLDEMEYMLDYE